MDNSNNNNTNSKCPVDHNNNINPNNNIPIDLDSKPKDISLLKKLSTARQTSSIPTKDDQNSNSKFWEYPSMLQFYNALERKGMPVEPEYIQPMLFIHNSINELGWQEIMKWEKQECQTPKLVSLKGLANKQSLKSRYCELVYGTPKPFDRHDWIVDRCGKKIRYIIDYYHEDLQSIEESGMYVDVRPALNSIQNIKDRIHRRIFGEDNK